MTKRKTVYIEMDRVLCDFGSGIKKVSDEVKAQYLGRFNEIPGLYSLMDPIPGAIDAMHRMQKDGHYDMYILTTAPWNNPSAWTDKMLWVQKYLDDVFNRRVIISPNKSIINGDYIIDYSNGNGTKHFKGEWIQFGRNDFPDWESVLKYLNVE